MGELALAVVDTYEDLFIEYVIGGVRASLAQVQAHEYVVPDAVREQAWHVLSFALDVDAAWEVTKELLLELAPKMEQGGLRETWIPYLERAIQVSQLIKDGSAESEFGYQIGLLYRLQSKHEIAREWFSYSLTTMSGNRCKFIQARIFNQLAYVELQNGNADSGIEYANKALSILDDQHVEKAMSLSVLGLATGERSQWQQAEQLHRQALCIRENSGDRRQIAWSLQNLAITLQRQKQFDDAIMTYQRALDILIEIHDYVNQAIVVMNLGLTYYYQGNAQAAIDKYELAEKVFIKCGDFLNQARLYVNWGLACLDLDLAEHAEHKFAKAVNLFAQVGNNGLRLNAIDGLALAYLAQHKYYRAQNVLLKGIEDLVLSREVPNYEYLWQAMHNHLQRAQGGLKGR